MTAMTELFTWNDLYPSELTPADGIRAYLGGGAYPLYECEVAFLAHDFALSVDSLLDRFDLSFRGTTFYGPEGVDLGWAEDEARCAVDCYWVWEDTEGASSSDWPAWEH